MKRNLLSTIVILVISLCLFMTACDSEVYQNGDITFALAEAIDMPVNVYIDGSKVATISAGSKSTTVNILASTFKPGSIVYKTTYSGDLEGTGSKSYDIGYTVGYDVNLPIRGTASVTMTIADSKILDSYTATYDTSFAISYADDELGEVVDGAYYLISKFDNSVDTVIIPSTINGTDVFVPPYQSVMTEEVTDYPSPFTAESLIKNVYVSYGAYVGDSAFADITTIEKVNIASDNLGSNVFSGCTGINNVVLEEGVTKVGTGTFTDCTNLTEISLPESFTTINADIFKGSGLKSLIVNGSNVTVVAAAFNGYTELESVVFNGSVSLIGDGAFLGCTSLTNLKFNSTVASIGKEAFSNDPISSELTLDGIEFIGNYAFSYYPLTKPHNLTGVLTINVPADKELIIKESAFRVSKVSDSTVSAIVINGNVCIEKNAFLYMSESSVIINGNVSKIEVAAFGSSSNLSDFAINGTLSTYSEQNEKGEKYAIFGGTLLAKDADKRVFYTANEKYTLDESGFIISKEQIDQSEQIN